MTQHSKPKMRLVRAYELKDSDKGYRVLVDRLWPRGVKKESLRLDRWMKELAPSTALRKWFAHDVDKWQEFQRRYREELGDKRDVAQTLLDNAGKRTILLIYAAKDEEHNHAIVLRDFIQEEVC